MKAARTARGIILFVAFLAVIGLGWLCWRMLFAPEEKPEPAPSAATQTEAPPETMTTTTVPATKPGKTQPGQTAGEKPVEIPVWEQKIDQVLRSNVNETATAQILISMLPSLPEDGQVEASHHISNLLADKDYNSVTPLLVNPSTPQPVLSVLMTDLMNRGDATKLRALLEIAKVPNHPMHDEAASDLQIFLGEDFGTDWAKWNAALERYLAKQTAQP
jgi:hypothetical protein